MKMCRAKNWLLLAIIVYIFVSPKQILADDCNGVLSDSLSGMNFLDKMMEFPVLRALLESDAGTLEGYSVLDHTRMVLEVFQSQKHFFFER